MERTVSRELSDGKPEVRTTVAPVIRADLRILWPLLPLLALVAITFLPALANGWVDFDDDVNFTQNSKFGGLSWAGTRWAFTTFHLDVYQPFGWLVLQAQSSCWGLHAWGYHFVSLLCHAINIVVLYVLIIKLLRRVGMDSTDRPWLIYISSAFAAGLYSVHPLRVEAVAWVSCQCYLPCTFFALLTVLAYLRTYPRGGPASKNWWFASLLCFSAASLCKAPAVTLPMVLLVLDIWVLGRIGNSGPVRSITHCALEKLPFLMISLALSVTAVQARTGLAPLTNGGLLLRLEWACSSVLFYLGKTVSPFGLTHFYRPTENPNWYDVELLMAMGIVAGITAVLLWQHRRWPGILAAWLAYLIILSPNSGLFRNDVYILADRYR